MSFLEKYPVPLNELLLSPLVFRETLPCLADLPEPTAGPMRDTAEFGGYPAGTVRTAMSRLRTSGEVETSTDTNGTVRYRLAAFARSISRAVRDRPARPQGFLLAVFAFASEDGRERQMVRDTLRYHGFQKLAQNAYINGRIDTAPLQAVFEERGLADNVYLFSCPDVESASLRRRLLEVFDLPGRQKVLTRLLADLRAFLGATGLDGDEFARRLLYAGPVHYRLTYMEEPPIPAAYLPPDYPLQELSDLLPQTAERRAADLRAYFGRLDTRS